MFNFELLPLGTVVRATHYRTTVDDDGKSVAFRLGDLGVIENYWVSVRGLGFNKRDLAVPYPYLIKTPRTATLFLCGPDDFKVQALGDVTHTEVVQTEEDR